jgi:hypothetical protein
VPHIINVYIEPGFVNVAMEPPHECFWIEASPDMPAVLKHRCVEAFEKLHAQGILHGDAELRHILINANVSVTIIDFKAAATCVPLENVGMEEVGLRKATPEEFRLEMRRVKFKLDYDGAREKERRKLMRKKRGELRKEDALDPPVDSHILNFHWLEGCERPPTRFVVPGQTEEQVELAVKRFSKRVREMERQTGKKTPVAQGREQEAPDAPEVPVAPPRQKLVINLPPLSSLRSPIHGAPSLTPLLPPLEIFRNPEPTPRIQEVFAELLPLAGEEASLQPGPSTENGTEDKAATHPDEAFLVPGFGLLSPANVVGALPPVAVPRLRNYDGRISPFLASFDFPVGKWADRDSIHSLGWEDRGDTSRGTGTTLPATLTSPPSAFPIMRTFADVARKAIQVFGRLAGQPPVQSTANPSQQQKTFDLGQRKRGRSESSASESSEYQAQLQRKRIRRSAPSSHSPRASFSPQSAVTPIPRTWSRITMGQSRKTMKRKRESEGTSKLVWNMEQELRRKRRKLSELSDISNASGSETEDDTTRDRTARLRATSAESVMDISALLPDTLLATRRYGVPRPDKKASILVRDYAYISHNAPRAHYVPHPPTENRMAVERAKHIYLSNAKVCLDAGLPYPMTENQQGKLVPDLSTSPYMFSAETFQEKQERKRREKQMGVKGAGRVQRSFGSLKRKMDTRRVGTGGEFEEMLYAGWKDVSRRLKKKVTSKVRFNMENLRSDAPGPGVGANSGVLRRMVRSVKETSGILKRTPPIKVFDYQAPWDGGDDTPLSPKVGPELEHWDRTGGFGMLGVWAKETKTKTEEAFREECGLRLCESQRTIESVGAEWQREAERMAEVRRREGEGSAIGL